MLIKEDIQLEMSEANKYNIDWSITQSCNFTCHYCHVSKKEADEEIDLEYVVELLEKTNKVWTITISGGEPMLHPRFVEICECLSQGHYIKINSNLTCVDTLEELLKKVDNSKILHIDASLHLHERKRHEQQFDIIRKSISLLNQHKISFDLNNVLHPHNSLETDKEVRKFQSELGIKILQKRYKGIYKSKYYPLSYSKEEKEIVKDHFNKSQNKLDYNYRGVPCYAGSNLLKIRDNGDVFRCPGDKTPLSKLGNINKRNVNLLSGPQKCIVSKCPCWGPNNVVLNEKQKLLQEAIDCYVKGYSDEAKKIYLQVIARFKCSISYNNLACIEFESGNNENAFTYIKEACQINSKNSTILRNKFFLSSSKIELNKSLPKKFLKSIERSIRLNNQMIILRDFSENKDIDELWARPRLKEFIFKIMNRSSAIRKILNTLFKILRIT